MSESRVPLAISQAFVSAEEFSQSHKAIGREVERVAHDLTNSLSATLMHLRFLLQSPGLPDGFRQSLRDIEAESERAAILTRELLVLSRTQTGRLPDLSSGDNLLGQTPPARQIKGGKSGGNQTILLVEDETTLRRMLSLSLRKLGYSVLEAANGTEAIDLWKKKREQIALLLTDFTIPGGMNGLELAVMMAAEKHDLKIILTSGNSVDLTQQAANTGLEMIRVAKPYEVGALAATLRDCLIKTAATR